jgi:hypothetical protein
MGSHAYWYTVSYQPQIDVALEELREREFRAGRYNPAMPFISFPITASSPAPGPRHRTIDDAVAAAEEDGTRSILDIQGLADEPDFAVAGPLREDQLDQYFGTQTPSAAQVEASLDFLEEVDRGQAVYVVCHTGDVPTDLVFAGMSFD